MNQYEITYFLFPEENVTITIEANSEEDAITFAKEYRTDPFTVKSKSRKEN